MNIEQFENLEPIFGLLFFPVAGILILNLVEYLQRRWEDRRLGAERRQLPKLKKWARRLGKQVSDQVGRCRTDLEFNVEAPGFFDLQFPPAKKFWTAMTQWQNRDDDMPGDKLLAEAEELQRLFDEAVTAARTAGSDYLHLTERDWRRIKKSIAATR